MAIDFTNGYPILKWDLTKPLPFFVYEGVKDDSANGLKVMIIQDGDVITPTTEKLRIFCFKSDSQSVYIDAVPSGDYFVFNLTNQIFAVVGDVECQLQLDSGGKWKHSSTFPYKVTKNIIDGSVESSSVFIALQDALNKVDNLESTYASRLSAVETGKLDKASVANNQATTTAGLALDARQANPNIPGTLGAQITTLNDNLGNLTERFEGIGENVTDVNNVIESGNYTVVASAANIPIANYCLLTVETGAGGAWIFHTLKYIDGSMYKRRNINNVGWTDWEV
jgi:hypothetical protein